MPEKIYPTKGCITNNVCDLSDLKRPWYLIGGKKHIQGIAQLGDQYIVLSSSVNQVALILAYGDENEKKVVSCKALPNSPNTYSHAGGIAALEVTDGYMILVPVYMDDNSNYQGSILHYFLPQGNGVQNLEYKDFLPITERVYAVGVAKRDDDSVVIAVGIDNKGNKVKFFKSNAQCFANAQNWQGVYQELGIWEPDDIWGGYPNSISLGSYDQDIYFFGMWNSGYAFKWRTGWGKDLVDIYSANLRDPNRPQLCNIKNFHAICSKAPSFRWGGNARIHNGRIEVLAVEKHVHRNSYVRYDKFCIEINNENEEGQPVLSPSITRDQLT